MGTNLEKMMYFYIIHGWNSTLVCYPGNLATVKLFQQISNVAILSPCSLVAEDVKITSRDHAGSTMRGSYLSAIAHLPSYSLSWF